MKVTLWATRAAAALAFAALPFAAFAQSPASPATPPPAMPAPTATPLLPTSIPTFGPASSVESLPYPAYGPTTAGVGLGVAAPGIPPQISLKDAIDIGLARSPTLVAALANERVSKAAVNAAASAIFPNISASASTSRIHDQPGSSRTNGTGTTSTLTNFTSNSLTVSLKQLIFDGGKIAAQLRQAKATDAAAYDTYRRTSETIALNVATSYYNVLSAERLTQVALATVQLDQVQEDLVREQVRAGTAAKADISTAELPTAQARLAVVKAQGAQLSAVAAFSSAMGLGANVAVLPADDAADFTNPTLLITTIPPFDRALTRALALRPDYASAQATLASAEAAYRAAKLGTFPNLSAVASGGPASTDATGGSYRNSSTIGLSLTVPIFDQGLTAAQRAQTQAQIDVARAQAQSTEQTVELDVKNALVGLVSSRAALDQARAELAKARDVLASTQAQYRAGVTTLPLLLNAQVGLTQALSDSVTAVYTLRQAEQTYLYATGSNVNQQ